MSEPHDELEERAALAVAQFFGENDSPLDAARAVLALVQKEQENAADIPPCRCSTSAAGGSPTPPRRRAMDELIARLEAATEGDAFLDGAIAVAAGPFRLHHDRKSIWDLREQPARMMVCKTKGDGWTDQEAARTLAPCLSLPHYTTSLDAALTLIPDGGKRWRLFAEQSPTDDGPWWHVTLRRHAADQEFTGGFTTPALAICIAALRARSHTAPQEK